MNTKSQLPMPSFVGNASGQSSPPLCFTPPAKVDKNIDQPMLCCCRKAPRSQCMAAIGNAQPRCNLKLFSSLTARLMSCICCRIFFFLFFFYRVNFHKFAIFFKSFDMVEFVYFLDVSAQNYLFSS